MKKHCGWIFLFDDDFEFYEIADQDTSSGSIENDFFHGDDGSEGYTYSDGSAYWHGADSSDGYKYSDGSAYWHGADGTDAYRYSDGSGYWHGADGSDGYRYSDGSGYWHGADGSDGYIYADGSGYYVYDDGTRVDFDSDDEDEDEDDSPSYGSSSAYSMYRAASSVHAPARATSSTSHTSSSNKAATIVAIVFGIIAFSIPFVMMFNFWIGEQIAIREGKINAGFYRDLVGEDYEYVVAHLESAGFTNIELIDLDDSGLLFWTDGKVDKVTIDGDNTFESTDWFYPDVEVIVAYH